MFTLLPPRLCHRSSSLQLTRFLHISRLVLSSGSPPDPHALREQVRRADYEGYVCGHFLGEASASHLAIRALNAEVASVRDGARGNAQAARLRMAFWRDFVDV